MDKILEMERQIAMMKKEALGKKFEFIFHEYFPIPSTRK